MKSLSFAFFFWKKNKSHKLTFHKKLGRIKLQVKEMKEIKMQYRIGTHSYTKEIPFLNMSLLEKQFSLSIPLITGATLSWKMKKKYEKNGNVK